MSDESTAPSDWPSEWLRGVLGVCVLRVLSDGPTYGYAIGTALADGGLGTLKGGTLYPLLKRLEDAGHVTIEWRAGEGGPGRKYYHLTRSGEDELARAGDQWTQFTEVTRTIIHGTRAALPLTPEVQS
ncbi:PadR family transcriptional regulator [Sanguibacter sp. 25GB23B1]|uniref:PadR family transcriptional regulator n=1 Tax=unclassified Sanguibacter TaxID=2645534 RepID=UPI0032AFF81E